MTSAAPTRLVRDTAALIRAQIENSAKSTLPGMRWLCGRYGVSRSTMIRVTHLLRQVGLVEFHQGQTIRICGRGPVAPPPPTTSVAHIRDLLLDRIQSGVYRSQRALPKQQRIALEEHVSASTVRRALRELQQEGVIYKKGKSFHAGCQPGAGLSGRAIENPVIFVLCAHTTSWRSLCRGSPAEAFGRTFHQEAQSHGCVIRFAAVMNSALYPDSLDADQIHGAIAALGSRYAGTLVAGKQQEIPALHDRLRALLRHKRPVVWFDRAGEGLSPAIDSPLFTRCHYSESRALETALSYLVQRGHSQILYSYPATVHWQSYRAEVAARCVAEKFLDVKLRVYRERPPADWLKPAESGLLDELGALHRRNIQPCRGALDYFVANCARLVSKYAQHRAGDGPFAGLVALANAVHGGLRGLDEHDTRFHEQVKGALGLLPLFHHRGCTAVIAPNDEIARQRHLRHARALGIKIPHDLSVISFDNSFAFGPLRLTSVDMGFGPLGYQAFHTIAGGVPTRRQRGRDIAAQPAVVEQETVAPPRQRRIFAARCGNDSAAATWARKVAPR